MLRSLKWAALLSLTLASSQALADITVYSGQHKQGTQAIADSFTQKTGIKVNIRDGSSEQMAGQLAEEGKKTPADVFFSEQIPPMLSLSEKGLLEKLDKKTIQATEFPGVPQSENQDWVATTGRARVVVFDPESIEEDDLADSVLDYATKKWQGRIGYVPTSGAFLEQVIAIAKMKGEKEALNWLEGLKKYGKSYANNKVALQAVESGQVEAALINNYYWYNMAKERGGKDNVRSRLHFIGNQDPGAMVTYASIAVLKGADNKKEAKQFVDYVVSKEGQKAFADVRAEYPLRDDVKSGFDMMPYKDLEAPDIPPTTFEDKKKAISLLEKAGLK